MSDDPPAPWDFEALTMAVRGALAQVSKLDARPRRSVEWNGPLLTTSSILCSCPNVDEQLSDASLAYSAERDRDGVDVVIGIALQLGIEQGLRMAAKDKAMHVDVAIGFLDRLRVAVNRV